MTTSMSDRVEPGELPRRPRLAAGVGAYQRAADEVQIGLDPRLGVLLTDLPPAVVRVLCALNGGETLRALLARVRSDDRRVLCEVLRSLCERGLVTDKDGLPGGAEPVWSLRHREPSDAGRLLDATVLVLGSGPLATGIATLLESCGVGRISAVVTEETDGDASWPVATPAAAGRWRDLCVDLVVITDVAAPEPALVGRLMSRRQAHVPVRVREGIGIVGPLVRPGRTSCLACADLHRADRDGRWPMVAGQLAGRPQHADPVSAQATAALAAAQIRRTLGQSAERPPLWNATLELDLFEGVAHRRLWYPHPRCPCGAADG